MKKVMVIFSLAVLVVFSASPAFAGCGTCQGSHSKGGGHSDHAHGSKGGGYSSDSESLKRAADLLREDYPALSANLERIGKGLQDDGHNHMH